MHLGELSWAALRGALALVLMQWAWQSGWLTGISRGLSDYALYHFAAPPPGLLPLVLMGLGALLPVQALLEPPARRGPWQLLGCCLVLTAFTAALPAQGMYLITIAEVGVGEAAGATSAAVSKWLALIPGFPLDTRALLAIATAPLWGLAWARWRAAERPYAHFVVPLLVPLLPFVVSGLSHAMTVRDDPGGTLGWALGWATVGLILGGATQLQLVVREAWEQED